MGTNYYANIPASCSDPKHGETLHIGKSSGGWVFLHRGYPERIDPLRTWEQWLELLGEEGVRITSEYEEVITLPKLIEVVTNRGLAPKSERTQRYNGYWTDPDGRDFCGYDFS